MALSGRAVSYLKCKDYLYIKSSEHSDFIPIDTYYEKIVKNNPKFKFTHEKLSKCKFRYKGEIKKYTELCTVNCEQMKLPTFYDDTAVNIEHCGTVTQEKGYCLRLLNTFDRYLAKARYETIKAATLLDVDFLNSDADVKPYSWQYFQRCYNAENAIYSYYSLYEIVVLLVYICENQGRGLSFEEYSKKCHSDSYRKCLKEKDNELYRWLSEEDQGANKTRIHSDFAKVTGWCNSFKHRGKIRFDGEYVEEPAQTVFIPEPGIDMRPYFSVNNEFSYIDLDTDVIPELFNYHKKIIELVTKVIEHCKIKEKEIVTVEDKTNG